MSVISRKNKVLSDGTFCAGRHPETLDIRLEHHAPDIHDTYQVWMGEDEAERLATNLLKLVEIIRQEKARGT